MSFCSMVLLCTIMTHLHAQTTRYVKPVASGSGNGSSWANAAADLQTVLNASVSGDKIWLSAGVYKPTAYPTGCVNCASARDYTFQIPSGVAIYGGFNGTETQLSSRDVTANVTILSGDIDNNDINTDGNNIAENPTQIVGSNALHVVLFINASNSTLFDGLTLTAGNADVVDNPNASNTPKVGTMYLWRENGGAMLSQMTDYSHPQFAHCTFLGNKAVSRGGVYYSDASSPYAPSTPASFAGASTSFRNCVFSKNTSSNGGAICKPSGGGNVAIFYENCQFNDNYVPSSSRGGCISGPLLPSAYADSLVHCTFTRNTGGNGGVLFGYAKLYDCQAFYNIGIYGGVFYSSVDMARCVFIGNTAFDGGVYCAEPAAFSQPGAYHCTASDCVFYGNSADNNGGVIYMSVEGIQEFCGTQLTNCVLVNNTAGGYAKAIGSESADGFDAMLLNAQIRLFGCIIYDGATPTGFEDEYVGGLQTLMVFEQCVLPTAGVIPILTSPYINTLDNTTNAPIFLDINDPDGADNMWGTADDGLQLACNSAGIDIAPYTRASNDLLGHTTYNNLVDAGPYERQTAACGGGVYTGTATCQTYTFSNISGNTWQELIYNGQLIANINPNGQNLGTVTIQTSDPTGTILRGSTRFLGRCVNVTATNAPTSNYSLRLHYKDSELTEYNTATSGSFAPSDFNISWATSPTNCDLTLASQGTIAKSSITTGESGISNDGFYLQFNLNHFTVFGATTQQVALDVELLDFSGKNTEGGNLLTWTTANEINNKGFQVERRQTTGGDIWETLGFIAAKGKGATYQFLDDKMLKILGGLQTLQELSYYRLRQQDNDGKEAFSKIIAIENAKILRGPIRIYPNPTHDILTVDNGNQAIDQITVTNTLGQVVQTFQKLATSEKSLDLSTLPTGTYFVRVQSGNTLVTEKVFKR